MASTIDTPDDGGHRVKRSVIGRIYGFVKSRRQLDAAAVWISRRVRESPPTSRLNVVLGPLRARFRGEMPGADMLAVVHALEAEGVRFWVAGGWGVDLLSGCRSRRHDDLDIVLADYEHDEPRARGTLAALGYHQDEVLDGLWMTPRSLLSDRAAHQIEILGFDRARLDHALGSDDAGSGPRPAIHDQYPELFTTGSYEGRRVPCLSVRLQLLFHTGFELRGVDTPDIERLRAMETPGLSSDVAPAMPPSST
jgi:lincosamide nucleotidyltransferase A/C/D/E